MNEPSPAYDLPAIDAALGGDAPSSPPPDEAPTPAPAQPFPIEALPEPLRSMVQDATRQTGAPVALCAAFGLGAASASIGSGLSVQSDSATLTGANLFILAFADSGTGKGRAFNTMLRPYNDEAKRITDEWTQNEFPRLQSDLEAARSDLERGKKLRKNAKNPTDKANALEIIQDATRSIQEAEAALARRPLFNIDNATAEAIGEALSYAPGEAAPLLSSEARDVVDNLLGRYSKDGKGSDESIFLKAYSGDPHTCLRKGKPAITLRCPRLTLCIAAQPDIWFRLATNPRMTESGFLARALIFDAKAPPSRPTDFTIPEGVTQAWGKRIVSLMQFRSNESKYVIQPTPAARAIIEQLAHESADARLPGGKWFSVKSFAARLAENAWRLAMVLHGIRRGADAPHHELSVETATAAVALARWFFGETLALLGPVSARRFPPRMEKLMSLFQQKAARRIPVSVLGGNNGFDREELLSLSATFPNLLRIVAAAIGPHGGRPGENAEIAPFETSPAPEANNP